MAGSTSPARGLAETGPPGTRPLRPFADHGRDDDILVARRQWLTWFHLFEHVGTRWFNDPARAYHAESKVRQLAVAGRLGFDVPPTLLTRDRDSALAFDASHEPCVVKSVASAFWEFSDQSFVFTVDAHQALAADSRCWQRQPVPVQQRIDGTQRGSGDRVRQIRKKRPSESRAPDASEMVGRQAHPFTRQAAIVAADTSENTSMSAKHGKPKPELNPAIPRLVKAEARDPYMLWVEFDVGTSGLVDMCLEDQSLPSVWQTPEGWTDVKVEHGVPVWSGWYDACPYGIWKQLTGQTST